MTTKVGDYDISRSVPVSSQLWRRQLFLVACGGTRFVGIHDSITENLIGALVYVSNMAVQPQPPDASGKAGFRIVMSVQALVPFELLGPVTVQLENADYNIGLWTQPDEVSSWFFTEYQNYFDPPKVVPATQLPIVGLK